MLRFFRRCDIYPAFGIPKFAQVAQTFRDSSTDKHGAAKPQPQGSKQTNVGTTAGMEGVQEPRPSQPNVCQLNEKAGFEQKVTKGTKKALTADGRKSMP